MTGLKCAHKVWSGGKRCARWGSNVFMRPCCARRKKKCVGYQKRGSKYQKGYVFCHFIFAGEFLFSLSLVFIRYVTGRSWLLKDKMVRMELTPTSNCIECV